MKVLDLAGGSGYYSFRLLSWGAAHVTSMDISGAMVEAGRAEALRGGVGEERLRFVVGDASAETALDALGTGRYDIIHAAWLLNYAKSAAELERMFANIAQRLKPGGWFMGLTTPPLLTDEPWEADLLAKAFSPTGVWGRWGTTGQVLGRMEGGEGSRVLTQLRLVDDGHAEGASVDFENHHVRKDVLDEAVASTGCLVPLQWADWTCEEGLREEFPQMVTDASLLPHCRVCITRRTS